MLYFYYDNGSKQFLPIAEAKADLKVEFGAVVKP
jgi:hypothetical protein